MKGAIVGKPSRARGVRREAGELASLLAEIGGDPGDATAALRSFGIYLPPPPDARMRVGLVGKVYDLVPHDGGRPGFACVPVVTS